jgi:hypothetical protein
VKRKDLNYWQTRFSQNPYGVPASIIIAAIVLAYFSGNFPEYFTGEDFFIFHWAETHNYGEALINWYLVNGRPIDAIYWISEYWIVGYQPAILHMISYGMSLLCIITGAYAIFRVWPHKYRDNFTIPIFILTAFFFPHAVNWSYQLASDHVYLGLTLYFLAVIFAQRWAISGFQTRWLALSVVVFILAILTYENVSFLFPIAIVLSLPLAKFKSSRQRKQITRLSILVSVSSLLLIILPLIIYNQLAATVPEFAHPAFRGQNILDNVPQRLTSSAVVLIKFLYNFTSGLSLAPAKNLIAVQLFSAIFWVGLIAFPSIFLLQKIRLSKPDTEGWKATALVASGISYIILGLLPYTLWGGGNVENPNVRFFSLPVFGVTILALLAINFAAKFGRTIALSFCILVTLAGLFEFSLLAKAWVPREHDPIFNFPALLDVVPRVKEGTAFLFIDGPIGGSPWLGCELALRMLYATRDLRCGYLSSSNADFQAIRSNGVIQTSEGSPGSAVAQVRPGLTLDENNLILIGLDENGERFVVPEISPDSILLIDWQSIDPLQTNFDLILFDQPLQQTRMVKHLELRSNTR